MSNRIEALFATPKPTITEISAEENQAALLVAAETQSLVEKLLNQEETGNFVDTRKPDAEKPNDYIYIARQIKTGDIQVSHWIRNREGRAAHINLRVFEFLQDMVIINESNRTYSRYSQTFNQQPVRRIANQDDLRNLNTTLENCAPIDL